MSGDVSVSTVAHSFSDNAIPAATIVRWVAMKSVSFPPIRPDVRALLDAERVVPALLTSVRKRAITRARTALVADTLLPSAAVMAVSRTRWAIVLVAAVVTSTAAAVAAYEIGARHQSDALHEVARIERPSARTSPAGVGASTAATSAATVAITPSMSPVSTNRTPSPADTGPHELRLLREARAAVASEDFAAALVCIGEHERRFKAGRLVEEREALRVKALAGLGRTEQARRAALAFEGRFPRSVLLPAVSRMLASEP